MDYSLELRNFLDSNGRLKSYPSKYRLKICALMYMACKFEKGEVYSEKRVNEILSKYHTFDDCCLLRRELFNKKFFNRHKDGTEYRLEEKQPELSDFGLK